MPTKPDLSLLDINAEVTKAIAAGRPVVALESTIVCHGMPYPQNAETALCASRRRFANPAQSPR